MKKYITIPVLATVTLLLAIGIVVACTKENTNKTTTTEAPGNARKLTTEQKLANELFSIWHKSDSAYRANATSFLYTCGEEDFETFYEMTNISEAQIDSIYAWEVKLYNPHVQNVIDDTPCIPCNTSLALYGRNISVMRAVIDELEQYQDTDTVPCFMPYVDSCTRVCVYLKHYSGDALTWCLLNCSLSKELDRMSIHLAAVKADE